MTNEKLQELCQLWQKRLRMQDWKIEAVFKINKRNATGLARTSNQLKQAEILIMSEENFNNNDADWWSPYSLEEILVHELLEIMFNSIRDEHDKESYDYRWEQNINLLAEALVNAYKPGESQQ